MKKIFIISISAIFLFACSGTSQKNKASETKKDSANSNTTSVVTQKNNYYNEVALFVAGLPLDSSSKYAKIASTESNKEFVSLTNKAFKNFENSKLKNIRNWVTTELTDINKTTKNVFYPFSGPDFIYVYSFFPNANNYYLFGLEPVGRVPNIEKIKEDSINRFFKGLKKAISDNLNYSFFKTINMREDLSSSQMNGTIPLLLFYMSRLGVHIQDVVPIGVDNAGNIVPLKGNVKNSVENKFEKGVQISFIKNGETTVSNLYYFSKDISDNGLKETPEYKKLISNISANSTTFVKSASYLMHKDYFGYVRKSIIDNASNLVQDDTGVPFRFLNNDNWKKSYYGVYTKPIDLFEFRGQDDLKAALNANAKKLNFRFGYNPNSNLLIARRIKK